MWKRLLVLCSVLLLFAALVLYLRPSLRETGQRVDTTSLLVSPNDMAHVRAKAEEGDCDAALLLSRHYMNEELQLEAGTRWLRIAARCSNADVKASLARILMHNEDDPTTVTELNHLISEVRAIDPERAEQLESERKGMQGLH